MNKERRHALVAYAMVWFAIGWVCQALFLKYLGD